MSIHVVSQKPSNKPSLLTFMVVAEKESSTVLHQITTSFARSSLDLNGNQVEKLLSVTPCLFLRNGVFFFLIKEEEVSH